MATLQGRLLLFFLIIFGNHILAQKIDFRNISTKENLSHNTTIGITRDREGFVWIATIDGLNRFDGYSCKVYKKDPSDTTSIPANFLHSVYEDSRGFLWITSRNGGLIKLNKYTEKFKSYKHAPDDPNSLASDNVKGIIEDGNNNLWIATEEGLSLLEPRQEIFEKFINDPDDSTSISSNWINAIIKSKNGDLWISTINGLNKLNVKTRRFTRFFSENSPHSLSHSYTTTLYEDEDGILWIGNRVGGLNSYSNDRFHDYTQAFLEAFNTLPMGINSIVSYDDENLLIATEGLGLVLFNKKSKKFSSFNIPSKQNNYSVITIYKDQQGIFWMTTWGGGVNKLVVNKKGFHELFKEEGQIKPNSIFAITMDREGLLWVNGKDRDIISYDPLTRKSVFYKVPFTKDAVVSGIGVLFVDSKGVLWIGGDGLIRRNDDGSFTRFHYETNNNNSISSNDIKYITEDADGYLWIGTEDGGACRYDVLNDKWKRYFFDKNNKIVVRTILQDQEKNMWFGTYTKGLIKLNSATGDTLNFQNNKNDPYSLSNNDVRHIIQDSDGEIWIATYGGGINKFNRKTGRFKRITTSEGLSNNFTYGILEDEQHNFWISTNYGITKYNRKSNTFKIYTEDDGLQNNEFNTGSFYKDAEGHLYFGGIGGLNKFHPEEIKDNDFVPPVYLTSFKIFDKEMDSDTAIAYMRELELSYADKFFSFEFSALDFINPEENKYAYMLEGFDDKWIDAGDRRFGSYTNLDPGNYTLKVKAANNDGVWNEEGHRLSLRVKPPFWRTTWFLILASLIILSFIILVARYYSTRKLKKQIRILEKEQLVQKERERISRDLHDNVGSQLTFLVSSIDNLTYYPDNQRLLAKVGEISNYGRKTMKELRNTIWAMKHDEADLGELILKLNELKQEVNSSIGYSFLNIKNNAGENIKLSVGKAISIYRIVQEAVQNVVKHAEATQVDVLFNKNDDFVILQILDNGKGFDIEEVSYGNGLDNMRRRCEEIGGNIDISSNSKGTILTCEIPK